VTLKDDVLTACEGEEALSLLHSEWSVGVVALDPLL
jgi:hypothetical protein